MEVIQTRAGNLVSFQKAGDGPPLVLVHGAFSDHHTNWEFVAPEFEKHFTTYAVARRGRGKTSATKDHRLEDESRDVEAVIEHIGEPVYLLGHSYGAQTALGTAALMPDRVRKLVLYEAPWPAIIRQDVLQSLETLADEERWDEFTESFFSRMLFVPDEDLKQLRESELWPPIVADASASLCDIRAVSRYDFDPHRFRDLRIPVLLQIGTESPRDLYVTDALAAVLPNARIGELVGQAHEGMTTAPDQYAAAVLEFLREPELSR